MYTIISELSCLLGGTVLGVAFVSPPLKKVTPKIVPFSGPGSPRPIRSPSGMEVCHTPSLPTEIIPTPGLHNKIPAYKIFTRGWVAQEPFCS